VKLSLKQTCSKRWTLTQIIFVLSRELPLRHIHAGRKQWTLTQRIMFCLVNSHADRYAKKRWTLTQIIVLCLVNSHSNIYKPQVCRLVNSQTDVYTIRTANCYPNTCVLSSELPLRKTCHKRKFSPKQLCCHADIYIQPNVNCELSPKQFERYQGRLANNIKQNVQFVYQKRSILPHSPAWSSTWGWITSGASGSCNGAGTTGSGWSRYCTLVGTIFPPKCNKSEKR
jgi:hypothetical protein